MRKGVDGRLHVLAVLEEVAGCEGLHCEGEVHDLCRMAIPCCKVHEAAFSHEEDGLAVWQDIAFDVLAGFVVRDGDAFQILAADFAVEVASIRTDGAVLHREEMRLGDDVDVAGYGEEMSPCLAASAIGMTSNPSITASMALMGSTSVTMTWAPRPFARIAQPLPHQP